MKLAPRFCRTCGSKILVRGVCHNCKRDPLYGNSYCYDCGAGTPNGAMCLHCGATFHKKFSPLFSFLIVAAFVITAGITLFLIFYYDRPPSETQTVATKEVTDQKPPDTTVVTKPVTNNSIKNADTTQKPDAQEFTIDELKAYKIRCSYFRKQKEVLFFTDKSSGYLKIDGKILELARTHRGNDVAVFSGDSFETTVKIEGLTGSAKEWLASVTLTVRNINQKSGVKYKVYSSCIEL